MCVPGVVLFHDCAISFGVEFTLALTFREIECRREDGETAAELTMTESEYSAGDIIRTIGGKSVKIPKKVRSSSLEHVVVFVFVRVSELVRKFFTVYVCFLHACVDLKLPLTRKLVSHSMSFFCSLSTYWHTYAMCIFPKE